MSKYVGEKRIDVGEVAYERLGRSERSMTLVSTEELRPGKDGMELFRLHDYPMRLWRVLMHAQDRIDTKKMCYIAVYVTDRDIEQKPPEGNPMDYFHNQGYAGI